MSVESSTTSLKTLRVVVLYIMVPLLVADGIGLVVLGVKALHGASSAEDNRKAVCSVLLSIPPGRRSASIREALSIDNCRNVRLPSVAPPRTAVTPSPQPTRTSHRPSSVSGPATFVVSPAPTATRTVTARPSSSPRPSRSSQPRPSPSRPAPTPSETPTCPITLLTIRVCN